MKFKSILAVLFVMLLFIPALSRADVKDNAGIFGQQAVDDADRDMQKMKENHNKELVVETFSDIPDDQKQAYAQHPDTFFKDWMVARAKSLKVNGVYVLICMDPHHLEVGAGKNTVAHGDFTQADEDALYAQLKADLHDKKYNQALSDAVDSVERAYTANISEPAGRAATAPRESDYSTGRYRGNEPQPAIPSFPSNPGASTGSWGSVICLVVGVVIIISLIRSIFRGSGGGGYPTGGPWGGNYGGNYGGGNYGGGNYGGGFGGGGGGFGRGFLGGLLGGALGGYVENRFDHQDNPGGFSQGNQTGDTGGFFGGGGGAGSYDPGPSDAGQGFGDTSTGGDFGSSGGGDSGGGGGGGSSGGDF